MRFERERRRRPTLVLTPLIDVVFLLLIFFLLTGTFAPTDPFSVQPPVSESGSPEAFRNLVIFAGAGGQVALNDISVSPVQLETLLRERLASGLVDSITIKADASVSSGRLLAILARTERAGVAGVRLVTVPSIQGVPTGRNP